MIATIIDTHFTNGQIMELLAGLVSIITSLVLFSYRKFGISLVMLTTGAFILRWMIIGMDPFLYTWDEQFHALVAKNMMQNPLTPMLYKNPVLPFSPEGWTDSHIWLHKQPLFLWIMAISLKIFGVNEIGVRMPSVILSSLMVPMIYRMGKLLLNESAGYFAALLFASAGYQIEMVTGIINSDHNDVMFMFFICASFWAWFEYTYTGEKKWIYLIGLFSGMAVLVKWLMGLLVYFCWGISIITSKLKRNETSNYRNLLVSFFTALIVIAPWQIYILITFHSEAIVAYKAFSEHLFQVVEAHSAGIFYYFQLMPTQYGGLITYTLLPALLLLYRKISNTDAKKVIVIWPVVTFCVYSIAQTKMPLFTSTCAPAVYIAVGYLLSATMDFVKNRFNKLIVVMSYLVCIVITYSNISPNEIETHHSDEIGWEVTQRNWFKGNKLVFMKLKYLLPENAIVFNCKDDNAPSDMFYSGLEVYKGIPSEQTFEELKKRNLKLAVFDDGVLPPYLEDDNSIEKLDYNFIKESEKVKKRNPEQ